MGCAAHGRCVAAATSSAGTSRGRVDLTAPLSERTPIIQLPEPFVNTPGFSLAGAQPLRRSRTGVVLERVLGRRARRHPLRRAGSLGDRQGRARRGARCRPPSWWRRPWSSTSRPRPPRTPTTCSSPTTSRPGKPSTAGCPTVAGSCSAPAGTPGPMTSAASSTPTTPDRTRPGCPPSAPAGWPRSARSSGIGVETVGTDAGRAHSFDPPFPCHSFFLGNGKYGLTQLANVGRLPVTGSVLIASPLPIEGGSGSPCRVLALVERD